MNKLATIILCGLALLSVAAMSYLPHRRAAFRGAPSGASLLTDLVAYWDMDETSGTRFDSHGSNDLTDNNTVGYTNNLVVNSAFFIEANDEYLSAADSDALTLTNENWTVAAWVNLRAKANQNVIYSDYTSTGNQRSLSIFYNNSTDRFSAFVSSNGASVLTIAANNFGSPSVGTWYLVTMWHDADNDQLGIQVNDGTPNTTSHGTGVYKSNHELRIGSIGYSGAQMDGTIDEVGVWRRVLSSSDISTLYNGGAGITYADF